MRIILFLAFTLSTFQVLFSQKNSTKKSNLEFQSGYARFDKNFDGVYLWGGYNYNFNQHLIAHTNISFDLGRNSKNSNGIKDSYWATTLATGIKSELNLFKGHSFRIGPDLGIMILNLNKGSITEDPLLMPIIYGFSASYLVKVNENLKIGLNFSQQYMTNLDFTNQRIGFTVLLL